MTFALVEQVIEQGGYERIVLFNNGDPERYPWQPGSLDSEGVTSAGVMTIEAKGRGLHQMYNSFLRLCESWATGLYAAGIFNNDIELLSDRFLERLVNGLFSADDLAAVSGTEDSSYASGIVHPSRCEQGFQGNAMLLRGGLPQRFDETLEWWYGDSDIVACWETAGMRVGVVGGALFEHLHGGSVSVTKYAQEVDYWEGIKRDTQRFYRKWGNIIPPSKSIPLPAGRPDISIA